MKAAAFRRVVRSVGHTARSALRSTNVIPMSEGDIEMNERLNITATTARDVAAVRELLRLRASADTARELNDSAADGEVDR